MVHYESEKPPSWSSRMRGATGPNTLAQVTRFRLTRCTRRHKHFASKAGSGFPTPQKEFPRLAPDAQNER